MSHARFFAVREQKEFGHAVTGPNTHAGIGIGGNSGTTL
jgi:hypothetical protein